MGSSGSMVGSGVNASQSLSPNGIMAPPLPYVAAPSLNTVGISRGRDGPCQAGGLRHGPHDQHTPGYSRPSTPSTRASVMDRSTIACVEILYSKKAYYPSLQEDWMLYHTKKGASRAWPYFSPMQF